MSEYLEYMFPNTGKGIDILIKEEQCGMFKIWTDANISFVKEVPGIVNANTNNCYGYYTFFIDPRYNKNVVLDNLIQYLSNISHRLLTYTIKRYENRYNSYSSS